MSDIYTAIFDKLTRLGLEFDNLPANANGSSPLYFDVMC